MTIDVDELLTRSQTKEIYKTLVSQYPDLPMETKAAWKYMLMMTEVPRPSHHLDKIRERVVSLAPSLSSEVEVDSIGNVRFRKQPSPGFEKVPKLCLQGHLDMVTSANSDVNFDFFTQPIDVYLADGWLKARGTTLGADNGVGVACGLAVLEMAGQPDGSLKQHGMIEVLCTVDEETNMGGASALAPHPFLLSDILLNGDSEEEYSICIGCAGGAEFDVSPSVQREAAKDDSLVIRKLNMFGLSGGHSGVDIHRGKGNANKLLMQLLDMVSQKLPVRLISFQGGSAPNVIPREAVAVVAVPSAQLSDFEAEIHTELKRMQHTYLAVESSLVDGKRQSLINLSITAEEPNHLPLDVSSSQKVFDLVRIFPNGVIRLNYDVTDLVDTSINLSHVTLKAEETSFNVHGFGRSPSESQLRFIHDHIKALSRIFSAPTPAELNFFPGWEPDVTSSALSLLKEAHVELFNKQPRIYAVHAGLECGIIQSIYPKLQCVSIGPEILNAHSPDEKLNIESYDRFIRLTMAYINKVTASAK